MKSCDLQWTTINATLSPTMDIYTGNMETDNRSRFLIEFFTHNELENNFPVDLTGNENPTTYT